MHHLTPKNLRVLFQGDSITDCGRDREEFSSLGKGYVSLIPEKLGYPPEMEVLNRGISGHRIVDLYARWKPDALHLKPDVLSILIGTNDTWHEFASQNGVEVPRYATIYRLLLEWTREVLPQTQLVLCEPFVLPCGVVGPGWREDIDERRRVVAQLAEDFGATFVPFQTEFDEALHRQPAAFWAADGVHPTPMGHDLMADCWIRHTEKLF
jgi:lysophospholipase L1-like esterase